MSPALVEAFRHLVEALRQVELPPGRTYRCRVDDRLIELRVESIPPELAPTPLVEEDIRLEPWVELPEPAGGIVGVSQLGKPDWPDIPEIPQEDTAS